MSSLPIDATCPLLGSMLITHHSHPPNDVNSSIPLSPMKGLCLRLIPGHFPDKHSAEAL